MDFAVTLKYLVTCSSDCRLKFYDISSRKLEGSFPIEGLATCLCVFENMEKESEIPLELNDKLGTEFTYVALSIINITVVYKYNFKFKSLIHLKTIVEPNKYVGGIS